MNEQIIFKDHDDLTNGNMVVLTSGRLDIYNKIDGIRMSEPTTTLRKCEAKSAPVNKWTELDGYWKERPEVILSPKHIPTYYARGRYGRQKFTLGCTVEASDRPMKYKIYPSCNFLIEAGTSGGINIDEHIGSVWGNTLWPLGNFSDKISTLMTSPQFGCGDLTVNFSWRTVYGWSGASPGAADFRADIFLEVIKAGENGNPERITVQLVSESAFFSTQEQQTLSKTVAVGKFAYSWCLRKETYIQNIRAGTSNIGAEHSLTLNSYSCSVSAETLNPSGEVFYLAIGR